MKRFFIFLVFILSLEAKELSVDDVYERSLLIEDHLHFLLKHYKVDHIHIKENDFLISAKLKPRNCWQKSYELLVKINRLRLAHNLLRIEPIGMEPVENLTVSMLYGMVDRVLAEIVIFEHRVGLNVPEFTIKKVYGKNLLDVYNELSVISNDFDRLNGAPISYSYIYAETMRIYDDLTIILKHLQIKDNTIPEIRKDDASLHDAMKSSLNLLGSITRMQRLVGIDTIEYTEFYKKDKSRSDLYNIVGLIVSELQPLKAFMGLNKSVTPPALSYENKTTADIVQLMSWNYRKFRLIKNLERK